MMIIIHTLLGILDDFSSRRKIFNVANGCYGTMVVLDLIGSIWSRSQFHQLLISTRTDSKSWNTLNKTTNLMTAIAIELSFMILIVVAASFVRTSSSVNLLVIVIIMGGRDAAVLIGMVQLVLLMARLPTHQNNNNNNNNNNGVLVATTPASPLAIATIGMPPSSPMGGAKSAWGGTSSPSPPLPRGGSLVYQNYPHNSNSPPQRRHTNPGNHQNHNGSVFTNAGDSIATVTPGASPHSPLPPATARAYLTISEYH
jgi:hypothetical protein